MQVCDIIYTPTHVCGSVCERGREILHIYMHVCMCVSVCVCTHVRVEINMHAFMCACACVRACVRVCVGAWGVVQRACVRVVLRGCMLDGWSVHMATCVLVYACVYVGGRGV